MRHIRTLLGAVLALAIITACASTPEPKPTIIANPDGSFSVISESDDPTAQAYAQVLSNMIDAAEAARAGGSNLSDEEIWRTNEDGSMLHIQSGGYCPAIWGQFTRTQSYIIKRNGTDVSCNFNNAETGSILTFYFYQVAAEPEAEAEGALEAMRYRVPDGKRVPLAARWKNPDFSTAILSSDVNGKRIRNGVVVARSGPWLVKLRMTYPDANAAAFELMALTMLQGQVERLVQYAAADREPGEDVVPDPTI